VAKHTAPDLRRHDRWPCFILGMLFRQRYTPALVCGMCVHDIERRLRAVVPGPDIVAVHKNT